MRFAILALLGLMTVDAIKVHQQTAVEAEAEVEGAPTVQQIINACD
jgi:hypothetical protein